MLEHTIFCGLVDAILPRLWLDLASFLERSELGGCSCCGEDSEGACRAEIYLSVIVVWKYMAGIENMCKYPGRPRRCDRRPRTVSSLFRLVLVPIPISVPGAAVGAGVVLSAPGGRDRAWMFLGG